MGNCLFAGEIHGRIKVITSNGGIMELESPVTAGCIAGEFPGYGIFKSQDLFWKPLPHDHELLPGKSYYLLPAKGEMGVIRPREGHVRSNSVPAAAPYRMSFDHGRHAAGAHGRHVLRSSQAEVWKVKLVISPKRLVEILEEEARTKELIQSVRTVAKCGSAGTTSSFSSAMAFTDHWSLSATTAVSTPSVSSKSGALLEI